MRTIRWRCCATRSAILREKTNALAFTFPNVLKGTWKATPKRADGMHGENIVKTATMKVNGKNQKVWLSSVKVWDPGEKTPTMTAGGALLPGVGPALICDYEKDMSPLWVCTRLIKTEVAP
jgi:hypothetical protein